MAAIALEGKDVAVRPLYYGLLAFSELTANYSAWIPAEVRATGCNATAHVALDRDGRVKVLVISKDANAMQMEMRHSTSVTIRVELGAQIAEDDSQPHIHRNRSILMRGI